MSSRPTSLRCMLWTGGIWFVWAAALASGVWAVVTARSRPALSKGLLVLPTCAAGLILLERAVDAILYARRIPLISLADDARLEGYLTATAVNTLLLTGPLVAVGIVALRRLRVRSRNSHPAVVDKVT